MQTCIIVAYQPDLLTQTFFFHILCRRPFRLIHSSGHFLLTVIARTSLLVPADVFFPSAVAYTDQIVDTDVFLPLTWPTQANLFIHTDVYSPLLQPTQTNSFTRPFSFHWHSPHRLTHSHRCFLASVAAYTGQLVHMDVFFPLLHVA